MTAREFIDKYQEAQLNDEELQKLGISASFFQKEQKREILKNRNELTTDNPLIDLVNNYDVSSIEIGMITFCSTSEEKNGLYYIGKVELDSLTINKKTKEVEVYEGNTSHLLWSCSVNASCFLESLIKCNIFLNRRMVDDDLWDDMEATKIIVEECSETVGGSKYIDFYKMILGYYD